MKPMTSRQFVLKFVGACFVLLACIGVFDRIVDPFWYYRDVEIKGFNAVKTKFRRYERDVKPALLMREQPEAIILGSSFAEIGFDPNNPYFTDLGKLKSMNFALAGAAWPMVQCEFEFAVAHAQVKRALVGIHPGAMPMADCAKDFASIGQVSTGELLLSSRALAASLQTIREQKKERPSHTREGMYFYTRHKAGVDKRFREFFAMRTQAKPECLQAADPGYEIPQPLVEASLDLSGLQSMIQTANKHQVQLTLIVYPRHAYSLELDKQCGKQLAAWQAMKQIARLNEQQAKAAVTIWQFYGYNGITTEPIGATATYWQDPEHFNFEMGDLMLADMFNDAGDKPKLGRRLTSRQIDKDYQDFLHERAEHLQHNSGFQAELQKLLTRKPTAH